MIEPTEEQYLVINALDTLGLLLENRFTPSPILPLAIILQNGEITPIEPSSEL